METEPALTLEERLVLDCLKLRQSNKQIADQLKKSIRTVEKQAISAVKKLGFENRYQYFAYQDQQARDQLLQPEEESFKVARDAYKTKSAEADELVDLSKSLLLNALSSLPQGGWMRSKHFAVYGMSQTAVEVCQAAARRGDRVTVLDPKAPTESARAAMRRLKRLGAPIIFNWTGDFEDLAADFIVVPPGISWKEPRIERALAAGILVMNDLDYAYSISRAPFIAIAGTTGKTTTAAMTWHLLEAAGFEAILCGRILGTEYDASGVVEAASKSHPGQILVAAISALQLEKASLFAPRVAAITNLDSDYLHRYRSDAEYKRVVLRLFKHISKDCTLVCNSNNPETWPKKKSHCSVLKYGYKDESALEALETNKALDLCGQQVLKNELQFSGSDYYSNALCAATITLSLGADPHCSWLGAGLRAFKGIPHRMEYLGTRKGVRYVNNSASNNPSSLVSSIQYDNLPKRVIVGGLTTPEVDFDPVRQAVEICGVNLYLYGSSADRFNTQLGDRWPTYHTLEEAFTSAVQDSKSGDTVMLSPGAYSMDQFENFIERGERFRALVLALPPQ